MLPPTEEFLPHPPLPPPPSCLGWLASPRLISAQIIASLLSLSCDAADKSHTRRARKKCHRSVTPTRPLHRSPSFAPRTAPTSSSPVSPPNFSGLSFLQTAEVQLCVVGGAACSDSLPVRALQAIKYSLSGEVCGPLSVCLLRALLIPAQNQIKVLRPR